MSTGEPRSSVLQPCTAAWAWVSETTVICPVASPSPPLSTLNTLRTTPGVPQGLSLILCSSYLSSGRSTSSLDDNLDSLVGPEKGACFHSALNHRRLGRTSSPNAPEEAFQSSVWASSLAVLLLYGEGQKAS